MAPVQPPRLLASLALCAVVLAPLAASAQNGRAAAVNGRPLVLSAEAVLLLDPDGRTLYAKNPEEDRAPASLVKLMTLYLVYEDVEAGRADLEELVLVSANAAQTPRYRMGLRAGEHVALRTLLEGVAIASANDAATALAQRLGGQTFVFNGRVHTRHIPLFNDPGGVQALKTGFTLEAGYNLAVSAWRNGQQFVMIVLGARPRAQSFLDAKKLLHYAFVEAGLEPAGDRARPEPRKPPFRARRAATH